MLDPSAMKLCALGSILLVAACSRTTSEPAPAADHPAAVTPASASAMSAVSDASAVHAGHAVFGVEPGTSAGPGTGGGSEDVTWTAPKTWTSVPSPSAMRKATYKVPRAPGDPEDGDLAISSAGGSVQANVDRWAAQFDGATPKTSERRLNGLAITVVEITGTYAGGAVMGGDAKPKPGWMLLGAIAKGSGDTLQFFKLVGPAKTVSAARGDFEQLVGSLRPKK